MNNNLIKLYLYLYKKGHYIESFDLISLIKLGGKRKTDHVATNKTERSQISEHHFTPEDNNPEKYREKVWHLYYLDIRNAHFERYRDKFLKEGFTEEEASERAEEKVKQITTKATDKAIDGHANFIKELMELDPDPNIPIVSPGSGFAHEQVVAPELSWRGLEFQKNLVDMANQRNRQLDNPGTSETWSVLTGVNPGEEIGDDWQAKLNTISDPHYREGESGVETVYAKHACGGLTDGVLFDAVKRHVPKLMIATCCAQRYPEISWRVLSPKDEDGRPLSFEEYKDVAKESKRQGERGDAACSVIDSWREDYLKENGYTVERGITEFGPFIRAIKLK